MQIFRPYLDHRKSAAFLDDLRLGKQRVEAKLVIKVILRKMGVLRDGKRGWLNHPIVQMYFNGGRPYLADLVAYFHAVVDEWKRRGFKNSVDLSDLISLLSKVEGEAGSPVTHIHEVEYRRALLLKDPCHYLYKLGEEELREILETDPVPINGVNTWLFKRLDSYWELVKRLKRGEVVCKSLFPYSRGTF
ncbi:pyrimidine dimer DNA glycosylase/endonuclease V [Pyrobaculum aerophilum]|uniref:Pyrimidine dimer DNA glycosylase n=2 Tax=Pyrobaculum aerophilum TaxID=13773 RepID=Q8ZUY5_PYRAE|nr:MULTISPECIES: pyrimidine dimer DNA glycosylase/endonuclease V [Pyrobaculum]AAL64271.1 hypothetical protein PAE2549 [Pyrobaculum aerophilum str. IM2]MCX8137706.1 pyrimidine dimer DNA glycosylase [Pyrobaculum aerophilum]HII45913.1 pyrimidine dimer DNA glycosylase [Pyrobaculum aerophilum]